MIKKEIIEIDGNTFVRTYSDDHRYVVNDAGVEYEEAIDPIEYTNERIYVEGDRYEVDAISAEEALSIILGKE